MQIHAAQSTACLKSRRPLRVLAKGSGMVACDAVQGLPSIISGRDRPYKAALLDQYGVLHDGHKPYPGAVEAVRKLREAGLQLYIISNSSRRSPVTASKLASLGFDSSWFEGTMTSGELTHMFLESRPDAWWAQLGRRALHITWAQPGGINLEGLGLQVVGEDQVAQADFILAHGTQAIGVADDGMSAPPLPRSLEQLKALLATAAALPQPPPMILANPDRVTVDGEGGLIPMPGTLAAYYESLGGRVEVMGKPGRRVYAACLDMMGGVGAHEVLAVGDSMEHDIGGAASAGIDSLLIAGGIHAELLLGQNSYAESQPVREAGLQTLTAQYGVSPQYVIPYFRW